MGILLGFALFATLILAVLVDPPPADEASSGGVGKKYVWRMMMATFKQMKDPNQLLLVPMTLWSGFDMTFWSADFTYVMKCDQESFKLILNRTFLQAFIACSLGLEKLCFIMLCMGVVSAFGSIACGYLVKVVGRIPLFLFGSLTNFALLVAMQFFWVPDPSKPEIFFIVAALNGITNAVWGTLINSKRTALLPSIPRPGLTLFFFVSQLFMPSSSLPTKRRPSPITDSGNPSDSPWACPTPLSFASASSSTSS